LHERNGRLDDFSFGIKEETKKNLFLSLLCVGTVAHTRKGSFLPSSQEAEEGVRWNNEIQRGNGSDKQTTEPFLFVFRLSPISPSLHLLFVWLSDLLVCFLCFLCFLSFLLYLSSFSCFIFFFRGGRGILDIFLSLWGTGRVVRWGSSQGEETFGIFFLYAIGFPLLSQIKKAEINKRLDAGTCEKKGETMRQNTHHPQHHTLGVPPKRYTHNGNGPCGRVGISLSTLFPFSFWVLPFFSLSWTHSCGGGRERERKGRATSWIAGQNTAFPH